MKVRDLKGFLLGYSDDAEVVFDKKKPFGITSLSNGGMYISSTRKIGSCKECGYAVYGIENYHGGEYCGYCPECKCNKTEFEINKK